MLVRCLLINNTLLKALVSLPRFTSGRGLDRGSQLPAADWKLRPFRIGEKPIQGFLKKQHLP